VTVGKWVIAACPVQPLLQLPVSTAAAVTLMKSPCCKATVSAGEYGIRTACLRGSSYSSAARWHMSHISCFHSVKNSQFALM
jgi:hypothetical protein